MLNCAGKRNLAVSLLLLSSLSVAALADATVDLMWAPTAQTVNVGDTVNVELWAFPSETVLFNGVQAIVTWDTAYLDLVGNVDPQYPPPPDPSIWSTSFPYGDSFGLNELYPLPQDGNGLWVGEVACGETLPADPTGLLLTTIQFEALAETPATDVAMLPELQLPGFPRARSKFLVGTYDVLDQVGGPCVVTIVPEPASVLALLAATILGLTRRR